MTKHEQVSFRTHDGQVTLVDKGLFDVLAYLNALGVKTQYSCQGGPRNAYVLADFRSFWQFIRRVKRYQRLGLYSDQASTFVKWMLRGQREFDYTDFRFNEATQTGYEKRRLQYGRAGKSEYADLYTFELMYSKLYGFRIVFRWPPEATAAVESLVSETWLLRKAGM